MGTRADNGDGSCREITTGRHFGKWRVQFTVADERGRKRRLSRLFDAKSTAKTFLQEMRQGKRIEVHRQSQELTLAGWFLWLAENDWPETLDEKTISTRRARFDKYTLHELGVVPLARVDPLVVREFYQRLREKGVGAATIHGVKKDLVRVFNQAIAPYQRVPMTMANPFRLTLQAAPLRDAVALTPEEGYQALTAPNLMDEHRAILAVFLLAGLRLSEQMALTRGQLLFEQDLILVDRAVKIGRSGKQVVDLPKRNKKRLAVMSPSLKRILINICRDKAPDDFIWPAFTENKPRMKTLTYATWRVIVKDAKLPVEMTPHDGRLTHINWIEKLMPSVSPTTLKEHVGHAGSGVTEVNYTRPLTSSQAILRDELERVVGLLS